MILFSLNLLSALGVPVLLILIGPILNIEGNIELDNSRFFVKFIFFWAIFGMFFLWISMIVDFLRYQKRFRVILGFFIIFGNYLAALIYFLFFYCPRFLKNNSNKQ